ncbi:Ger(x)C family spore germination protein [Paenibacillus sp.]|jgi:Ger(x)C family germination protein|uniref:Ger(x)C family spore germination protein n=1 Tax=Paenibacillus sp. TaxID=58172 RepID=UPI0028209968|nr:Ger(x)C family spore germination protein [Paenibacillus sp.]MDR0268130.1 Ger(x)C family spore germination protein [Paenibacillus sp.]
MKRLGVVFPFIISITMLTGCWDREYLKDINIAYSVGFDLTKDRKIKETVELIMPPESEQTGHKNEIHSAMGLTTRSASNELRSKVTGNISTIKNGVQLVGKNLARDGLMAPLDVNYRDSANPTSNVRLIVTEQDAAEIINLKKIGELQVGEFLTHKIESLEKMSRFYPPETMDSVFRALKDPGMDFVLPYIASEGKEVIIKGVALFHDQYYSGMLNTEDAIMLVLLKGRTGGDARISKKIDSGSADPTQGKISINVGKKKIKRKFDVLVTKNGEIHVNLSIKLKAYIEEYTGARSLNDEEVLKVNKELSDILTSDAQRVIRDLQKANCDVFGVGRQLIAYHNNVWRQKNWAEDYRKVHFHTKVSVAITSTGIIR